MTRYESLMPLVDVWSRTRAHLYADYQRLPFFLAERLRAYLGCPIDFSDSEGLRHLYVAPCRAEWRADVGGDGFVMTPTDAPVDWTFHADGRYYCGLRVFLESAPNAWPKEAFWMLLNAVREGETFDLRIVATGMDFAIVLDDGASANAFCAYVVEAISRALRQTPLRGDSRPAIGFATFGRTA